MAPKDNALRTIVQVGLHTSAELIGYTADDWTAKHNSFDGWTQLPENFVKDPSPFFYYGLDCCPESVDYVAKRYRHINHDRAKFICAGISDTFYTNVEFGSEQFVNQTWHSPELDLQSNIIYIFLPLQVLFKLLKIEKLDVLALDIEGYEYYALADICEWQIYPKLLIVEFHHKMLLSDENRESKYGDRREDILPQLLNDIYSCGYHKIYEEEDAWQIIMKFQIEED